ncbi:30S ribosome-binding factor RbfA [Coxiella endosymbiont of Amblyomma americanum]|uniref:30S ribosome-binding factor RbfA n=1 Tax=Coxiella endosymbiont of Amblyomma americanum TaxID=325775 RepID=UPI002DDD7C14|nr:30S ribosome-binding factor RbfA [Coxiella-like endosymbiont of Amblyomma americanum]
MKRLPNTILLNQRQRKVADLIHKKLAGFFKKEVHDPRLFAVVLTAVTVSSDLKRARVFYTFLEDRNLLEIQKTLNKATNYLRCLLAKVIMLRYVPFLLFCYDTSIERGNQILCLLNGLSTSRRTIDEGL